MDRNPNTALTRVYRDQYSRLIAVLVRACGSLDLAEDLAQDAMVAAWETWPTTGVPDNPLAWLITTAKNRGIDRLRRNSVAARNLALLYEPIADAGGSEELLDERLAMLLGCCHPDLKPADRIALMLRFVGGLSTIEVAHALLVPVTTLQARITRAKKRIRRNGILLQVPSELAERCRRMPLVLQVISVIFSEGYAATTGEAVIREELTAEAIRLARVVMALFPSEPEPAGLLALLLLCNARSPARTDAKGWPVALADQDRSLWRKADIAEGIELIERNAGLPGTGRWMIQAAIAACHAEALSFAQTDWPQIRVLYDLLLCHDPSPVVQLNRAIAVGRDEGFERGLELLDQLTKQPELVGYHSFHIARGLTLVELGRVDEARQAYRNALLLLGNDKERQLVEHWLMELC